MIEVLKQAYQLLLTEPHAPTVCDQLEVILRQAIADLESQEPVAWKLMPRDATDAMLKAMDECSTEGYDERLYAGHAASVYMSAWDALNTHPPQRTWVGMTTHEFKFIASKYLLYRETGLEYFQEELEQRYKENNT